MLVSLLISLVAVSFNVRGSDGVLLVYDVTYKKSFDNLGMWKNEFAQYADVPDIECFPFVCIGNKIDVTEDRAVSTAEASTWCTANALPYFETSAKVHGLAFSPMSLFVHLLSLKSKYYLQTYYYLFYFDISSLYPNNRIM